MEPICLPMKFRMAKLASGLSEYKIQIGCAIFRGNRLIGIGTNKLKTHPLIESGHVSMHAEQHAILTSKADLYGATIVVYRELKNGTPALAKPCSMCMEMIIGAGFGRLMYTTNEYPYYEDIKL